MRSFPVTINGEGLVLSMANDITERRQAEEERLRLLASLQQSEKIESIGTLAGGIAHDFNNILGIILGNAELAMDDIPEWNPARHNLDEARRACLRAKEVVGQILSFSRKSVVEQKPINLVPVVKESLKFLRASIPASVDIRENFSNDIDNILGDSAQIQQILINLCTNASHAMENEGGILEIALENTEIDEDTVSRHSDLNPGSYVHLRVTDTGDGINPEVIARIFDPYFTTKDVGKGTGLGLSVVHGIVNSHNGRITVESKTGKGTTFNILFPAVEKQIPEKPKKLDELPTGNETILFVDDEESMVNLNQQRLERLGYKVTGKTDPSEALEFFSSDPNQFDLVISDMTMPRMTCDQLTQEILKIRPDMPIILCTGYSNRISEERAQKLGIRKYIEKPIEMEPWQSRFGKFWIGNSPWKSSPLLALSAMYFRRSKTNISCDIDYICQQYFRTKCFSKFRFFEVLTKSTLMDYSQSITGFSMKRLTTIYGVSSKRLWFNALRAIPWEMRSLYLAVLRNSDRYATEE